MVTFRIIENTNNIKNIISDINMGSICTMIPIFSDSNLHSLNDKNELSMLYINVDNNQSYIFPFNHCDSTNIDSSLINNFFSIEIPILTFNKKSLHGITNISKLFDVNLMNYYINNTPLDISDIRVNAIDVFNNRYYNLKNVNSFIPLTKHIEWCDMLSDKLYSTVDTFKSFNDKDMVNSYNRYNTDVIESLHSIEQNGLYVSDNIVDQFDDRVKKHINNNIVYSNYNIYTSTGRPSNSFGNINFAALKKNTGERTSFISRFDNGILVEYDYDAYHLRLIGSLIGYNFSNESVHEHFSKIYDVSYEESKQITFKILYGGIDKEISDNIEFFKKTEMFIDELWSEFKSEKEIKTYIYNRPMCNRNFIDIDRSKLFNFYIQSMETEYNIKKIVKIQELLQNYNSKLVLYGYDSFLFDIDTRDGKQLLQDIRLELESDGFITKIESGKNYNDIIDVSDKI
jgi:hypothetical protein